MKKKKVNTLMQVRLWHKLLALAEINKLWVKMWVIPDWNIGLLVYVEQKAHKGEINFFLHCNVKLYYNI